MTSPYAGIYVVIGTVTFKRLVMSVIRTHCVFCPIADRIDPWLSQNNSCSLYYCMND